MSSLLKHNIAGHLHTDKFTLTGLTCADCADKLVARLRNIHGIEDVSLNFMSASLSVRHRLSTDAVIKLIAEAGYGAVIAGEAPVAQGFFTTHRRLVTTGLSTLLLLLAWSLSHFNVPLQVTLPLYLATILIGGWWTLRRGATALMRGSFDMNGLMTIAIIGAGIIGEWNEAATIAVLFSVSNMLESYSMEKTRNSLRKLMELTPPEATVRREGIELRLPVEALVIGDLVIVKPGEKIAVDGIITRGSSSVNQAAITGESMPVEKGEGSEVYAGTLNEHGAMEILVTRLADDTALAHIVHLVEEAQGQRAPSQAFVDRFARIYTPVILILAIGIAVVPPVFFSGVWSEWFYRALALIVVACPCALVISTPVAIVSAIGNAAKHGVLIKGGAYLEEMGRLSVIAFDKTGTLTQGRPNITGIYQTNGVGADTLLALAAAVESHSSHVLADAVLREAREQQLAIPEARNAATWPGRGAQATVNGRTVYVGNRRFFYEQGIDITAIEPQLREIESAGQTAILVGQDHGMLGVLTVADEIRPESQMLIRNLHAAGIRNVAMLTGDHLATAQRIAAEAGVDDVRADLLPEDKAGAVAELRERYGRIGMVGDGVNDAPALATANVGIAMGVAGTDTALETADIALMSDDLAKLPYTVRLSRKALRVIQQNIAIALALKLTAVALIFPGWLTLWMAVLADMGASIIVTINGLRLIRERAPERNALPQPCQEACCGGKCHG